MIDPATGWIEIHTIPSTRADLVSKIVELTWLIWYLLPSKVIVDRGSEFPAEFKTMVQANYGITVKPISSKNSQSNSILERLHQTIGDIICTI